MRADDGIGGAGFDTKAAEDAAIVVDVIDRGIPLATADTKLVGVLFRLNVNALGRAGGSAEEASNALLQAVFVALQHVSTAIALLEFGGRLGVVLRDGRRHHLLKGDA